MYNKCYIEAKNTDSRCVDEQFFFIVHYYRDERQAFIS